MVDIWQMDGLNRIDAIETGYPLTTNNNNKALSNLNTTINTATNGVDASQSFKVEVSQQQQQEVYNILKMLQGSSSTSQSGNHKNISSLTIHNKHQSHNDDGAEFEGEYNSGDDDIPNGKNDCNDFPDGSSRQEGGDGTKIKSFNVESTNKKKTPKLMSLVGSQSQTSLTNDSVVNHDNNKPSTPTRYYYGKPKLVQSIGRFTELGSILGPFFCLSQLGKGTFSSIHKCINLNFYHHQSTPNDNADKTRSSNRRLAAAKVELVDFQKSGVLEAEATILDYLHKTLPPNTVPVYMGHYKADEFAAIFMEYLPGEDMHQLREHVMARTTSDFNESLDDGTNVTTNISPPTRRINVHDAVYLTADVMLPLLQRMHEVGVVHRDVKPSNCVRSSIGLKSKEFCMVDFGLSKSIIVPEDSDFADKAHVWEQHHWLRPYTYQNTEVPIRGCYRIGRKKADFRGTSMYASLRVHQCKDYCPRDDVWSLLYVFCDLVSGGLPWMQHAASRERDACQRQKERIHGENETGECSEPEISELLKGDIYHKAYCQREKSLEAGIAEDRLPPLPEPLAMCEETLKVQSLAKAFAHVSKLQFWDKPDYKLIQDCIKVFARESNTKDPIISPIWETDKLSQEESNVSRKKRPHDEIHFVDETDPIDKRDDDIFDISDEIGDGQRKHHTFLDKIPLKFRFKIAQMDYHLSQLQSLKSKQQEVSTHRAMIDWMLVVVELLYKEWDTKKYEDGGHRTSTDGFRRDCYLQLLEKSRKYAKQFNDFGNRDLMYGLEVETGGTNIANGLTNGGSKTQDNRKPNKLRKIRIELPLPGFATDESNFFLLVSKAIFGLDVAIKSEQSKKSAPPVPISFG